MRALTILRTCPACQRRLIPSTAPLDANRRNACQCPNCSARLTAPWFARSAMHLWTVASEMLLYPLVLLIALVLTVLFSDWISISASLLVSWACIALLALLIVAVGFVLILSLYPIRADG